MLGHTGVEHDHALVGHRSGGVDLPGVTILHAGVGARDGALITAGGRVLNVVAAAATIAEARQRAYAAAGRISWPGVHHRSDIALEASS